MNRASSEVHEVVADLPPASPSAAPAAAVAAGSPDGDRPSAARLPGQLDNDWFWGVYPKKVEMVAADRYLSDLLGQGVARADIEGGARRYADHVRRKHLEDRYIKAPLNWLRGECWVNPYQDSKPAERAGDKSDKAPTKGSKRAQDPRSGSGKGEGVSGPAEAPKPARVETAEERSARLAAAAAKKAENAAKREALQKQRAEEEAATLARCLENRARFVAELTGAGIPECAIHSWTSTTLAKKGVSKNRTALSDGLSAALAFKSRERDEFGWHPLLTLFADSRLLRHVPAIIARFKEREQAARARLIELRDRLHRRLEELGIRVERAFEVETLLKSALRAQGRRLSKVSCEDAAWALFDFNLQTKEHDPDALSKLCVADVHELSHAIDWILTRRAVPSSIGAYPQRGAA